MASSLYFEYDQVIDVNALLILLLLFPCRVGQFKKRIQRWFLRLFSKRDSLLSMAK